MPPEKKPPYVAKVALRTRFSEARYSRNGEILEINTKGAGSSVPIAISRAVRLAFKHPNIKRKSPTGRHPRGPSGKQVRLCSPSGLRLSSYQRSHDS